MVIALHPSALASSKLKLMSSSDRPERALVDVDVDAGVVVHLAQVGGLGEHAGAELGQFLLGRLGADQFPFLGRRREHAERAERAVLQLDLAEAVLDQGLEGLLGGVDLAAAVAVGVDADGDAAEDGVGPLARAGRHIHHKGLAPPIIAAPAAAAAAEKTPAGRSCLESVRCYRVHVHSSSISIGAAEGHRRCFRQSERSELSLEPRPPRFVEIRMNFRDYDRVWKDLHISRRPPHHRPAGLRLDLEQTIVFGEALGLRDGTDFDLVTPMRRRGRRASCLRFRRCGH